jgi:hypothetical protein
LYDQIPGSMFNQNVSSSISGALKLNRRNGSNWALFT